MTLEEIKADIIGACREFQAAGKAIISGHWNEFSDGTICGGCALTAVHVMRCDNGDTTSDAISKRYGWNMDRVWHFIEGFDGVPFSTAAPVADDAREADADEDVFDLGRAVRQEVLP